MERWCAARAISSSTTFELSLTSNAAAPHTLYPPLPGALIPSEPSGASLMFLTRDRCLMAPTNGLSAYSCAHDPGAASPLLLSVRGGCCDPVSTTQLL